MRTGRSLAIATLLLASFVFTCKVLPHLPLRPGNYPRLQFVPRFPDQGDDAFFVTTGHQALDHIVLFHDFGKSIENARKADILLFGNSRQQAGLREAVIAREARKLKLRVFTIATGHADKTRFALDLIRKYDLRPKVVIASGGWFVFTEGTSPWAKEVMAMSRWQAWKFYWERTLAWAVESRLHRVLPRLDFFDQDLVRGWINYRSEVTGWWRRAVEPRGHYPVSMKPERESYRNTLPLAGELKQELDRRGALLVLTMVPYAGTQVGHLPFLSMELGVPAVIPSFKGMETSDGSHLTRASALRISRDFWDQFIALEAVRKKLGLDEAAPPPAERSRNSPD